MKKIYKLLPRYAIVPIAVSVVLNALTYFGTRIVTTGRYHYCLSSWLDSVTPFVPAMITIYILAYVSWVVGYVVIGRENRKVCYQVMVAEQIAKLICLATFIIFPTTLVRPEVTGTGIFDWLTRLIYSLDSPDNLLPSIHCLENWICFRGAMKCKKVSATYKTVMFIMAVLVFASTLMVKQHVIVDVVTAVVVVEIGLFLAKRFNLDKIYFIIEEKLKNLFRLK